MIINRDFDIIRRKKGSAWWRVAVPVASALLVAGGLAHAQSAAGSSSSSMSGSATPGAAPSTSASSNSKDETFSRVANIEVGGGGLTSFDISYYDPVLDLYFLADRGNKGIDVVDGTDDTFQETIPCNCVGFDPAAGNDSAGPNGVLTVRHKEIWAGDGDSTIKVIDLATKQVIHTISTGGQKRADELSYDGRDHLVLMANDADSPPFITFIDTNTYQVVGKIEYPQATNGLEQSQYSAKTGQFYLAVPEVNGKVGSGQVDQIDPKTMKVVNSFSLNNACEPAGMALGPGTKMLLGCSVNAGGPPNATVVIDYKTGSTLRVITDVGGADEVWFNPDDGHFFTGSGNNTTSGGAPAPVLGVIDSNSLKVDNPLPPTGVGSHSVAASPLSDDVFVPINASAKDSACPNGCIAVFKSDTPVDAQDETSE